MKPMDAVGARAGGWQVAVRMVLAGLLIVCLGAAVGSCGRKASPERPPDSDYPRQYPAR